MARKWRVLVSFFPPPFMIYWFDTKLLSRLLCLSLPDLRPLHAHVQAPVPLVPVAILRLLRRPTDLRFLEDPNRVSTYHKSISQIDFTLSNATHPMPTVGRNRARARARGTGHRRRYSKYHTPRPPAYETIEEISNASSPAQSLISKKSSPTTRQPIFVVDPTQFPSIQSQRNLPGTTNMGSLL